MNEKTLQVIRIKCYKYISLKNSNFRTGPENLETQVKIQYAYYREKFQTFVPLF